MVDVNVVRYHEELREKWEKFLSRTVNGTFLQSRAFLEYHKDRFVDHSLLFYRGSELIAICPAIEREGENGKEFISHQGSTFGSILVGTDFYTISNVGELVNALDEYLKANGFTYALIKNTGELFTKERGDLLDYSFFHNDYHHYDELSFGMPLANVDPNDVPKSFRSKTRNLFKSSLKGGLVFRELANDEEIKEFYSILEISLARHETKPVHSLEEIYDLCHNRIPTYVKFYGAFNGEQMVSGSMVFDFGDTFHTQYLASLPEFLYLKSMDFLVGNLVIEAKNKNYKNFSFGISTEERGKVLNENLAKFKEGFGATFYNNKTFYKHF